MNIRLLLFGAFTAFALILTDVSTCAADSVAETHPLWNTVRIALGYSNPCEDKSEKSCIRKYERCPPQQICPQTPSSTKQSETEQTVEEPGTPPPGEQPLTEPGASETVIPPSNALASNYGAASGPLSSAPNMIGDQFGGRMATSRIIRSFTFNNLTRDFSPTPNFFTVNASDGTRIALNQSPSGNQNVYPILDYNDAASRLGGLPLTSVPAGGTLAGGMTSIASNESFTSRFDVAYDVNIPSPGGLVGRMKIAEDTSPMPRDRLIFDYNYFDGVPLFPGGVNVSRFTPGLEKTFFDGWMSFELKLPMATTLDSTIVQDGVTNTSNGEFGNMLFTWKTLLLLRKKWAISGGLSVAPPTADNVNVVLADGTPLAQVLNRSTHLGPFLGFLWTPDDRWFAQGFLQYDVTASSNPVFINPLNGMGLANAGNIVDTPFQYMDIGVGYWAYRGHERFRRLTGWALTSELHWNHSLQAADTVQSGNWRVGDFASTVESFNLTLGTHIELYDTTTITFGYSVPLGGGLDREYNGEFRLMVNRRFGSQNRLKQATF